MSASPDRRDVRSSPRWSPALATSASLVFDVRVFTALAQQHEGEAREACLRIAAAAAAELGRREQMGLAVCPAYTDRKESR